MSDMHFTGDQKKVIDLDGRNILCSAAAGSGKTAVLVERIIRKITDIKNPVDVDRLLVVTFTRAAAAEMRDRLRTALDDRLSNTDDMKMRRLLKRQKTLLGHASICTIDSFALDVTRNHFNDCGIDPEFRTADDKMMKLLRKQTAGGVLKRHFESDDKVFSDFMSVYGRNNSEDTVIEMMDNLLKKADSFPWPEKWIDESVSIYKAKTFDDLLKTPLMGKIISLERSFLNVLLSNFEAWAEYVTPEAEVIYKYSKGEAEKIRNILDKENDLDFIDAVRRIEFSYFPKSTSKALTDADKLIHDEIKNQKDALAKSVSYKSFIWFRNTFNDAYNKSKKNKKEETEKTNAVSAEKTGIEKILSEIKEIEPVVTELASLTKEYRKELLKAKMKRNEYEFSDIEHFALDILIDSETGAPKPAAIELRKRYSEVMIDEYQDSNDLQEMIFKAVSRSDSDHGNYFMVGDVKQSIYRFREARPEIFINKLKNSSEDPKTNNVALTLSMNFRSRREVLDCTNMVFGKIMKKDAGGIDYTEKEELNLGRTDFPEGENDEYKPEYLYTYKSDKDSDDEDSEYKIIAEEILKLKKEGRLYDKATGGFRPVSFKDIVVLSRSSTDFPDLYDCLLSYGIPAYMEKKTGYFTTVEVENILSILELISNPYQDIPAASALSSPMFSGSRELMAEIRIEYPDMPFSDAVWSFASDHHDEKGYCNNAAVNLYDTLEKLRAQSPVLTVHEILQEIYKITGYLDYVRLLPGGDVRKANLEKLVDSAYDYECNVGGNINDFVNYIRDRKKYEIEEGEASVSGERDDLVRLSTIHKSKGLQYPVVILMKTDADLFKSRSGSDCVMTSDYGITIKKRKGKYKVRTKTFISDSLDLINKTDELGEYIRLLYVAMTRAEEKLIFTGSFKKKDPEKYEKTNDFPDIFSMNSFYKMLLPVKDSAYIFEDRTGAYERHEKDPAVRYSTTLKKKITNLSMKGLDEEADAIRQIITKEYPYGKAGGVKQKYSVSEFKTMEIDRLSPEIKKRDIEDGTDRKTDGPSPGAVRGTAYHRIMEVIDFEKDYKNLSDIEGEIKRITGLGLINESDANLIDPSDIFSFFSSDLAGRMKKASAAGKLCREMPFVMTEKAENLFPDGGFEEGDDEILIQGIIDAWFIDDGKVWLLDYKTDRVNDPDRLIMLYKKQLDLYSEALQRRMGMELGGSYLFSFYTGMEVRYK